MAQVNIKHGKKSKKKKKRKEKGKKKEKMWRGGGGGIFSIFCLIFDTLPQLEPSSLQPPSVLHHRHLLKTACYIHLLLLLIARKENRSRNRPRTTLTTGVEKSEGPSALQPTTAYIVQALVSFTDTTFSNILPYTLFFYKNLFYKNHRGSISQILRIS